MFSRQYALPAAFALCLAAPAGADEIMSAEDLLATIPGAVLTGISNEDGATPWVQTYGRDGQAKGVFGARDYSSSWAVRRDLWCEDWGSGSGCWRLERVDENTIQPYHGDRKLQNVWTIQRHSDTQPANG
ncbi:hypothetical protein M3P21_17650 [Ruegeria sp. 2012CJ41-6]|uniref:DUF995 domain-containing protein n=1 Tax=Ruegeria spongiae TaxID=2942209 RepID=A0ABT0Q861_9RHOB|nr:hypothetical protein [Ruegeria spongiae]MCL6285358.1 hypothetical protein [Ruegeria spongiae]